MDKWGEVDNVAFSAYISYSQGMQSFPAFYLVTIEDYSNDSMAGCEELKQWLSVLALLKENITFGVLLVVGGTM